MPDAPRHLCGSSRSTSAPTSHHWQVMAGVRASEHEAATIELGGARIRFAMTSGGDGVFPVSLERDAVGAPVAVHITVQGQD